MPRKYRTIVADPPWHYGKKWASITHGGKGPRIEKPIPYQEMDLPSICALPVASLADHDCRLFLWTTNRHLRQSFEVIDAWGFTYAQTIIWRKTGNPSPFAGGGVAPVQHEFLMVARLGHPEVVGKLPSSVIDAPAAVFGHSAKPEAFLDHIESVSPGPYLEMFARRNRLGWDTWGNEALEHVTLGGADAA